MSQKREYRTDIYERYAQYADMWIALTPDEKELLGHNKDLVKLAHLAKDKGYENPRFIHIPPANINFAF